MVKGKEKEEGRGGVERGKGGGMLTCMHLS